MLRLGSESDEEGEGEIEGRRKKWLKQYSPHHQILLVGEGDFSFSSSWASAFGSASNVTATSLDHYDVLIRKYKKAESNLRKLEKRGASLLHGVDATSMKLGARKFDRIIFNFPHAGFHGREDDMQLICMHRELMSGFFHNASQMLRADGEVHARHKTEAPYCHWNLEELASRNYLRLIDQTAFESKNYPGYYHKRGDGKRCDETFYLGASSTFKFRSYPGVREVLRESMMHNNAIHGEYRQLYGPVEFRPIDERSARLHVGFELAPSFGSLTSTTHFTLPRNTHIQLGMNSGNEYGGISAYHPNIMQEIPQRPRYDDAAFRSVPRLHVGFELAPSFGSLTSTTHFTLPRNTHIQLGMNSGNEYGGISAYHPNIMQEIPQRPCYDDAAFRSVPRPGLASEHDYADVERRTSVGDLYPFQREEFFRRLVSKYGRA